MVINREKTESSKEMTVHQMSKTQQKKKKKLFREMNSENMFWLRLLFVLIINISRYKLIRNTYIFILYADAASHLNDNLCFFDHF